MIQKISELGFDGRYENKVTNKYTLVFIHKALITYIANLYCCCCMAHGYK